MKVIVGCIVLLLSTAALAQNRVVVSAIAERHGEALSVFFGPRPGLLLGVSQNKLSDAQWIFATANYSHTIRRTTLQGEANLGRGHERRSFGYTILRVVATQEVATRRLFVEGEDQYVDVDRQRGHLARAGVTWMPSATTSLSASAYRSVAGNLGARFASGRGEWQSARIRLLAGGAWGRSQPVLFQQFAAPVSNIREIFAGATVPVNTGSVTFAIDELRASNNRRLRFIISWASRK